MSGQGREIARNTMVVAGATLISRGLGLVRDMIVAFTLGAGFMADAFFVAFRIPNLLRRLFGEGSLTMAFIPIYARTRAEQGDAAAHEMARSAMVWLVMILVAITLVVEVFAGGVVYLIAPGFTSNPELFDTTTALLRICFPYIILISGVALCMGLLNASGHFMAPAMSPVLLNLTLIIGALTGYYLGLSVAECMAWGGLAGGFLQWQMQQPYLKQQGFTWRGAWSWRDAGVRRMALLMLPTVFGAAVYQVNILLGTLLASYLPEGSVSYLYYADRLVQFPLGVFGIAVSTAALPSLSILAAEGKGEEFSSTLRSAMGLTLFIALPATAGLVALAEPIIAICFGRGAFTPEAVHATAMALVAYSAGLPFIAAARPLVAAFYARENTRTPVLIAVVSLVINIGLGLALMGPLAHLGLALAVSVSSAANALLLGLALTRSDGHSPIPASMIKSMILSAGIFLGAWLTRETSWYWLALIPFWVAIYLVVSRLIGMRETDMFLDILKRRMKRRSKA
ncbi:MAG: murein biosynthesis integral membrane protein MurJ [Proteobacteria bacterium]|nr:murein biosynthesis integral membrane protein MurJ [Pseudomonadota bacterium]MBU1612018.1 murein biosynthesis integral membrane protein MurJ [Pseudomonadota bacterium]